MKNKTKSEQLADYKRSNQLRREALWAKYGYASRESYEKYIGYKSTKKPAGSKVTPTIHNVFILDASGSMHGAKYNNGVKGINTLIKAIKEDKNPVINTISIVEFCTSKGITKPYWLSNPVSVKDFKGRGANGGTPLYQTLGEIIELLETQKDQDSKVLLNVFTDGQDTEGFGKYSNLPQTIKRIQEESNFTVTFVGTDYDVKRSINTLNIDASNTLVHDNTGTGVTMAFAVTTTATSNYSANVSKGLNVKTGFYKKVGTL